MPEDTNVNSVTAAYLLGISVGRVRQLLANQRMKGAFKVDNAWRIPLYNGMPEVLRAPKRNRKGSWETEGLETNRKKRFLDPETMVRPDSSVETYYQELEIKGPCKLVYNPYRPKNGSPLWIEIDQDVEVITRVVDPPSQE